MRRLTGSKKIAKLLILLMLSLGMLNTQAALEQEIEYCQTEKKLLEDISQLSFYEEDVFFLDFEWYIRCRRMTVISSLEATFTPIGGGESNHFPEIKAINIRLQRVPDIPELELDFVSCISLEHLSRAANMLLFCTEKSQTPKKGAYLLSIKNILLRPWQVDYINLDEAHLEFYHLNQDGFARLYSESYFSTGPIVLSALHKDNQTVLELLIINPNNLRVVARKTFDLGFSLPRVVPQLKLFTLKNGLIWVDFSKVVGEIRLGQASYNMQTQSWSELSFLD